MNGNKHCLNINKKEMNSMAGQSISKAKSFIMSVFFIRYIDDIFMTSNESLDIIKELLDKEGQKDANIGINYNIHQSTMEFLDVLIENNQGQLKTSVYRKPAAEPYILPYTSDHPRHIHSNTIHTALLRAIRLSSDVQTFDHERLNIEISLLLNGYSPKFITHHFKRFFRKHDALSIYQELDSERYQQLHASLLDQSTKSNGKQEQQQQQQHQQPQVQTEKMDKTVILKPKKLIIHCLFESGPLSKFNREFRKLWEKHFCYEKSPLNSVRLILGTRSNLSLDRLLVKKKPHHALLRQKDDTNEITNSTNPTALQTK